MEFSQLPGFTVNRLLGNLIEHPISNREFSLGHWGCWILDIPVARCTPRHEVIGMEMRTGGSVGSFCLPAFLRS